MLLGVFAASPMPIPTSILFTSFHATLASRPQKHGPNEIPVIETPIWKMILSQFVGLLDASDGESFPVILCSHKADHRRPLLEAKASKHWD